MGISETSVGDDVTCNEMEGDAVCDALSASNTT